jgi:hypothetical protein
MQRVGRCLHEFPTTEVVLVHVDSKSPILYVGTAVVLLSTIDDDGRPSLAPMSPAWWPGWRCTLGLASISKTTENLRRTGECVLNLLSAAQVGAVDSDRPHDRLRSRARRQAAYGSSARLPITASGQPIFRCTIATRSAGSSSRKPAPRA